MDSKVERKVEEIKQFPSKITGALVGSVILTVSALMASWPASTFLLMNYSNPQDTGALLVGSGFAALAVVLWAAVGWGWVKTYKNRKC